MIRYIATTRNCKYYIWYIKFLSYVIGLIFVIIGFSFISCGEMDNDSSKKEWKTLILNQLNLYPEMGVQDLYKLIYQAKMGPAHLGTDKDIILNYLNEELESINADTDINLIEKISPSGKYVRINLKKFKSDDGNKILLANAIALFAGGEVEDMEILSKRWNMISKMVDAGELPFDREKFRQFNDTVISKGFTIPHHSEEYLKCYSPAYRVVLRKYWDEIAQDVFN